jgi:DNA-binding CsgD family transcriptional regulator
MEFLKFQDTQKLLHGIEKLYSLRDLDSFGIKALAIVHQLVESEAPGFHTTNFQLGHITCTSFPGYPTPTPEMQKVARRYFKEHPLNCHMPRVLGGAYKISDFITPAELHRLEGCYQQYLRVINCEEQMCLFLASCTPQNWSEFVRWNPIVVGFSMNRSQRNFTERDRLILNLLRPHLTQAYQTVTQFQEIQQQLTQLQQSLDRSGVIFLDDLGQVKLITSRSASWLEDYFNCAHLFNRLPERLDSWVRHQLSQLKTDSNLPHPYLPLRLQLGDRQLTIRLVIDRPGKEYLLLLSEERRLSLLASLAAIGLSKQEAKILFWAIQGKDNKAIAREMRICYGTVRKHLENIYRKLNVHSRSEAVTAALEKCGCLNSLPLL